MTTLLLPASPGNRGTPSPASNAKRVAEAHRRLHDAQVDLAHGGGNSLAADEAATEYDRSVADAHAAKTAELQEFVASLRLLAGDDSGLKPIARRLLAEILDAPPSGASNDLADLAGVLIGVVEAAALLRQRLADIGNDMVGIDGRVGLVDSRVAAEEARGRARDQRQGRAESRLAAVEAALAAGQIGARP